MKPTSFAVLKAWLLYEDYRNVLTYYQLRTNMNAVIELEDLKEYVWKSFEKNGMSSKHISVFWILGITTTLSYITGYVRFSSVSPIRTKLVSVRPYNGRTVGECYMGVSQGSIIGHMSHIRWPTYEKWFALTTWVRSILHCIHRRNFAGKQQQNACTAGVNSLGSTFFGSAAPWNVWQQNQPEK